MKEILEVKHVDGLGRMLLSPIKIEWKGVQS